MKSQLLPLAFTLLLSVNLSSQTLQHAEILGRPTDHSITLQAVFAQVAEVCVQYGTTSGNLNNQTAWQTFGAGEPAEIVISNLAAHTRYFYRICHRVPGAASFTTRPQRRLPYPTPGGQHLHLCGAG